MFNRNNNSTLSIKCLVTFNAYIVYMEQSETNGKNMKKFILCDSSAKLIIDFTTFIQTLILY